jgi:quercetin dioxygenase-like cupin family protein
MSYRRWSAIVALWIMTASMATSGASSGELMKDEVEGFVLVRPEEIQWISNNDVPGVEAAILLGDPQRPGPLIVRVKLAANLRIEPHTHPDARTYTVLSGEWQLGFGDKFDAQKLRAYGQGSLYRLPAKVPHFQAAGPHGTTIQIESIGPSSTDFLNPSKQWSLPSGHEGK